MGRLYAKIGRLYAQNRRVCMGLKPDVVRPSIAVKVVLGLYTKVHMNGMVLTVCEYRVGDLQSKPLMESVYSYKN